MGRRVAPIRHSQSSRASLRSGEGISRLGGAEDRGQRERGEGVWEERRGSDRKTRT